LTHKLYIQDIPPWGPVEIVAPTDFKNRFSVSIKDSGVVDAELVYSPIAWEFILGARNSVDDEELLRRELIPQLIEEILSVLAFVTRLEEWHRETLEVLGTRIPAIEKELLDNKDLLTALQRRPSPIEPGVGAKGQIYDYLVAAGFDDEIVGRRKGFIPDILEGNKK
jgi:hypothetical protein